MYNYSCSYFSYLLINYFSYFLLEFLLLMRFAVSVLSNEALTLSTISGAGPGKQATKGCFKSSLIPERFKGEIKRHLSRKALQSEDISLGRGATARAVTSLKAF